MKVLVTGSSGQVGSYVVDDLADKSHQVVGLDRRPSRWTNLEQNLLDGINVEADAVVHCAAQVSVQASIEEPALDASANVMGTLAVLDWARREDARVVHFSSAAVYGTPQEVPVQESHPTVPLSPYGLSKLTSERYALLHGDLYGLDVVALRPFNIYSERSDPKSPYSGVVTKFVERVRKGLAPIILGDGEQTRDFIHALDVVHAVDIALHSNGMAGEVFNVGTGQATSIRELADCVLRAGGLRAEPRFEPPAAGDIRHSVADVQRLSEYGWMPQCSMAEGLETLLTKPTR